MKEEVIAFKEENVTLRGKVIALEKTLEITEKQKKNILVRMKLSRSLRHLL